MTRVSSGAKKSGPPCHQNQYAFVHNPASRLTKSIAAIPLGGVCVRCRDVLEWRKKFRKYKPLKEPRRCTRCGNKTVKDAYHAVCRDCAEREGVCGKCLQPQDGSGSGNSGGDGRGQEPALGTDGPERDADTDTDAENDADAGDDDDDD